MGAHLTSGDECLGLGAEALWGPGFCGGRSNEPQPLLASRALQAASAARPLIASCSYKSPMML